MSPSPERQPTDHACQYIRDIERLIVQVNVLTATVEQRLDRGEVKFDEMEKSLEEIRAMIAERRDFEQQMRGGAKLAGWLIAALGTLAAFLAIPHLG